MSFDWYYIHAIYYDEKWFESDPISGKVFDFYELDSMKEYCTNEVENANPPIGIVTEYEVQYGSIFVTHDLSTDKITSLDIDTKNNLSIINGTLHIFENISSRITGRPDFTTDSEFFQLSLITKDIPNFSYVEYHLLKLDELNTLMDYPNYPKNPTVLKYEEKI